MNYREAVDWLFGVTRFGMKLGIENTRDLLAPYGLPDPELRVIHVAGTNGKGSTCAFAHAVLHAAGHRTGLFTSPHLIDFRERIRVGAEIISEEATAHHLTDLRRRAEAMESHPSFFEIAFALALIHFRQSKAEYAVVETGLGGRLDATNVLTPDVSAITGIGLDHQQWLGETLSEIAGEKAGIIKPGVPTVSAPQDPDALAVLREHASRLSSPLEIVRPEAYPPQATLGLKGEHQRENAALALAALRAANIPLPDGSINAGLRDVTWPARFQILTLPPTHRPIVVDGAHNPHAARALRETWRSQFPGQKASLLYSSADGKNAAHFISELLPIARRIILTKSRSARAREPEDLRSELESNLRDLPEFILAPDPESALTIARKFPVPILATGSLFLAGDILAILQKSVRPDPSEVL